MLSEGMKKLFQKEREWEEDGLYDGRKATLDDVQVSFDSLDEADISKAAGDAPFEALQEELSRLRKEYGDNAELKTVEEKETMSGTFNHVMGDATQPADIRKIPIVIPHVCNDVGAWGAGFVLAVSRSVRSGPRDGVQDLVEGRLTVPQGTLKKVVKVRGNNGEFGLGATQFVKVPDLKLVVANMVAQHGLRAKRRTDARPSATARSSIACERYATSRWLLRRTSTVLASAATWQGEIGRRLVS
jgi:hypothetical protein